MGSRADDALPSVRPSLPTPAAGIDFALGGARRDGDSLALAAIVLMAVAALGLGVVAWRVLMHG